MKSKLQTGEFLTRVASEIVLIRNELLKIEADVMDNLEDAPSAKESASYQSLDKLVQSLQQLEDVVLNFSRCAADGDDAAFADWLEGLPLQDMRLRLMGQNECKAEQVHSGEVQFFDMY